MIVPKWRKQSQNSDVGFSGELPTTFDKLPRRTENDDVMEWRHTSSRGLNWLQPRKTTPQTLVMCRLCASWKSSQKKVRRCRPAPIQCRKGNNSHFSMMRRAAFFTVLVLTRPCKEERAQLSEGANGRSRWSEKERKPWFKTEKSLRALNPFCKFPLFPRDESQCERETHHSPSARVFAFLVRRQSPRFAKASCGFDKKRFSQKKTWLCRTSSSFACARLSQDASGNS